MWMTVAEDFDDFICVNLIDVPAKSKQFPYTQDEAKRFIKEEILGKDNTELHKVTLFLKCNFEVTVLNNIQNDALVMQKNDQALLNLMF